jgi:quercetin dioxygenase-like cupin family protein
MGNRAIYSGADSVAEQQESSFGVLQWLASDAIGNAKGLTLGRVTIKAGDSNPRHCHKTCEEVLYLMQGTLTHTLGEEEFTLEAGDTISIPAGVYHNGSNAGSVEADMIVAYDSAKRDFVLEE